MNNEIAVQEAVSNHGLLDADGMPVTTQQVYDAYMNGTVRIRCIYNNKEQYGDVIHLRWVDSDGQSVNTQDVVQVVLTFVMEEQIYFLQMFDGIPN